MGRKSAKNRKERPVLFPQDNQVNKESPKELFLGALVKIGRPSNRYFQYIFSSLDFLNIKMDDLALLSELEGLSARVTGVIQMVNGDELAIISKKDGQPFINDFNRLYVDGKKALSLGEIAIIE